MSFITENWIALSITAVLLTLVALSFLIKNGALGSRMQARYENKKEEVLDWFNRKTESVKRWRKSKKPTPLPPDDEDEHDEESDEPKSDEDQTKTGTLTFYLVFGGIFLSLIAIDFLVLHQYTNEVFGEEWNWGWFAFYIQMLYLGLSLQSVGVDYIGVKLFFGKPIQEVDSGLALVPLGLFSLEKAKKTVIQFEIPAEPELVQKDSQDRIEKGKKAPVRIVQASAEGAVYYDENGENPKRWSDLEQSEKASLASDPLHSRITSEVSGIVRFRIRKGHFIQLLQVTGSMEDAQKQIEDAVVVAWQDLMSTMTLGHSLARKGFISQRVFEAVKIRVGEREGKDGKRQPSWGVDILETPVKLIDPGEKVNTQIALTAASVAEKQEIVTRAEGEKRKRVLEGEGVAEARRVLLEAEAAGLEAQAKVASGEGGALVLHLQTLRSALENSNYSIVPMNDLTGAIAGVQEALQKVRSTPTP